MSAGYPELYVQGIALFNDEGFFECHDVLEEHWSEQVGDDKEFFQGLIHAAVCLFHFGEGNFGGAIKMYRSCSRYLSSYAPVFMGLDVDKFLADMDHCFEELNSVTGGYPVGIELKPERIPKIELMGLPSE